MITLVFCHGDTKLDKLIDAVETGYYSHVAVQILGSTLEALAYRDSGDKYPGTWLHSVNKYDNDPDVLCVPVDVPDMAGAEATARGLIGSPYGYIDALEAGIRDLTGISLQCDGPLTNDCSEAATRILRGGGFDVLPNTFADEITPGDLYKAIIGG